MELVGGGAVVGVGVDVVDLDRFRIILGRRPRMRERLFTPAERAEAERRSDPVPALAARFAAKEAAMKALSVGLGAFEFADVEVATGPGGAPALRVTGRAATIAEQRSARVWHLSLSHSGLVAVAVVVACASA